MKKIYLIAIPIALILAYGGYSIFNKTENPTGETSFQEQQGKKIPFADFLKKGGSYVCHVDQNVGGTLTKGTTYITDGMIRGEYNTNVQGMSIDTTLIVRDGYTYTWSSLMANKGFKAKVAGDMEEQLDMGMRGQYSFNAEEIGDYACEPWKKDGSLFKLPDSIEFQEV